MLFSEIQTNLQHAFRVGRISHAYIIVGNPRGVASDLAVFLMQLLACPNPSDPGTPCGNCNTCRQIASHTWSDSFWLSPAKKSRIISVQQMRRGPADSQNPFDPPYFIPWLSDTSFLGGWKFGIVVGADRMNQSAANAFLKMLEEPPQKTMMLLLTDAPQQLLPTIRSRCSTIEISEPPPELEPQYLDPLLSSLSSTNHEGPLAAAALSNHICAILSSLHEVAENEIKEEAKAEEIEGLDIDDDQQDALVAAAYREKRSLLILTLLRWFRDLQALCAGADDSVVHYKKYIAELHARASRLTLAQAISNVEAIEELAHQLDRNIPESTIFPYWLDRLNPGVPKS